MPELPEVETIRKTLEKLVLDKTIQDITIHWPNIIKYPDDVEHFKQLLIGEMIRKMDRRGKFLLFYFDHYVLVSHLRMEGKYSEIGRASCRERKEEVCLVESRKAEGD